VGYYRRRFTATKAARSILYFGGVDSIYFVWLNGAYVGFAKGSRLPAEYDVTDLLTDGENLLCVKVFTYCDGTYLENQDMLLASGIFRDVLLVQTEQLSVWDYEIITQENEVTVKVTLWDADYTDAAVSVELDGQTLTKPADKVVEFSVTVEDPHYWNAETPNLYPLYITLNLCRVLAYAREGLVLSKQEGGQWGLSHLPEAHRPLAALALDCYASNTAMSVKENTARTFAEDLLEMIRQAVG
jgi:beta-galactosidase/beta-glucuronidase